MQVIITIVIFKFYLLSLQLSINYFNIAGPLEGWSNERFRCSLCGAGSNTEDGVISHARVSHSSAPAFQCRLCARAFHELRALQNHFSKRHVRPKWVDLANTYLFISAWSLVVIGAVLQYYTESNKHSVIELQLFIVCRHQFVSVLLNIFNTALFRLSINLTRLVSCCDLNKYFKFREGWVTSRYFFMHSGVGGSLVSIRLPCWYRWLY